jgi:hypothetical protein
MARGGPLDFKDLPPAGAGTAKSWHVTKKEWAVTKAACCAAKKVGDTKHAMEIELTWCQAQHANCVYYCNSGKAENTDNCHAACDAELPLCVGRSDTGNCTFKYSVKW